MENNGDRPPTTANARRSIRPGASADRLRLSAVAPRLVQTICPIGYGSTTLELKVNLVKAITEKAGELTIKGKVLHAGKTTATSEATIVDAAGNLFAHSTCTCLKIKLQN